MTPQWIQDHAIINGPYHVTPQYFEIKATTGPGFQNALQIQLVPPGMLKANDSVYWQWILHCLRVMIMI